MKLILFRYTCEKCENHFKSGELPGEHYGEFLLRSNNGSVKYLMALDSEVFKIFDDILKKNILLNNFDDYDRATVLHEIFYAACDLSPDGAEYKIGGFPVCPNCKSNKMISWAPTNPPEFIDEDIQDVTFNMWNNLSEQDQILLVNNTVKEYLIKIGK